MSKLLAVGDSWTDPTYISPVDKKDFTRWPELLADKLGIDSVDNRGISGAGTNRMVSTALRQIMLDDSITHCAVLLSGWYRSDIVGIQVIPFSGPRSERNEERYQKHLKDTVLGVRARIRYYVEEMMTTKYAYLDRDLSYQVIFDNISSLGVLIHFCFERNIDIAIMQGPSPWPNNAIMRISRLHNSDIYNELYSKGYLFCVKNISKIDYREHALQRELTDEMLVKKHVDDHPNELGHKFIADSMYEFFKTLY